MPCDRIDPLVTPFVDGNLPEPDRRLVEEHLRACPPCHSRVAAERQGPELIRARVPALKQQNAPAAPPARGWQIARGTPRTADAEAPRAVASTRLGPRLAPYALAA